MQNDVVVPAATGTVDPIMRVRRLYQTRGRLSQSQIRSANHVGPEKFGARALADNPT